jgi:lipopolysaccharide/colanic/teichoic acid biosynthesis glycosyltransferase
MRSVRHARVSRRVQEGAAEQMRRLGDGVIACMLLALTAPLLVLVALAIKCESPGPVLDRHTCIGRGGRRFQMLKFRTLVHDPEHRMPVWGRKPTRIGQFLRHTRLDALPQLINVLRGEMSMIDPDGSSPSFLD